MRPCSSKMGRISFSSRFLGIWPTKSLMASWSFIGMVCGGLGMQDFRGGCCWTGIWWGIVSWPVLTCVAAMIVIVPLASEWRLDCVLNGLMLWDASGEWGRRSDSWGRQRTALLWAAGRCDVKHTVQWATSQSLAVLRAQVESVSKLRGIMWTRHAHS